MSFIWEINFNIFVDISLFITYSVYSTRKNKFTWVIKKGKLLEYNKYNKDNGI